MVSDPAIARLGSTIEKGTAWPRPVCPNCLSGHLRFASPTEVEHGHSRSARKNPAWEPDWIHGVFTTAGSCENPACEQPAVATGEYNVDWIGEQGYDEYERERPPYAVFYTVRQIYPPLVLMRFPESTPVAVQEGVARASAALLTDPGLAATALRLVVEQFLTSEGIASTRANGSFITTDRRIKAWGEAAAGRERVKELLLAVKWIGNAGTHDLTQLTLDEVLTGVEILDEVFHSLFVGPDIDVRAKAVNAAKGLGLRPTRPAQRDG